MGKKILLEARAAQLESDWKFFFWLFVMCLGQFVAIDFHNER
jgi:hypothetical protein